MRYGFSVCDIMKNSDNEIEFFTGESDIDKSVEAIRREFNIKLVLATMGKNGRKSYCGNAAASIVTGRRGALKVMPQKYEIDELRNYTAR